MKILITAILLALALSACDRRPSSDQIQSEQQERILAEGTAQTGMPAITKFRERKLMKQILEMRDQEGLPTFTYIVASQTGKLVFLCDSIGYGLPAATQYTSPQKVISYMSGHYAVVPQADPNGLYSPSSAEGTWVMCSDPSSEGKARPVYVEPRIITSPFKMAQ